MTLPILFFGIRNGVKQGDALSNGLFVLAIDPSEISRLQLGNLTMKSLALAEDIAVVTQSYSQAIATVLNESEILTMTSGRELSADKTEIFHQDRSTE